MNIEYRLFENGLDFILSSADYLKQLNAVSQKNEKKRLLKYSLLHLFSGIELILKYRLSQEHWTYVYADMNRADKKDFDDGNFQSVSIDRIFIRLKKLCGVDIKQHNRDGVERLRELRNKAMHFEIAENINAFEGHINKNLSFVISFVSDNFVISDLPEEEQGLLGQIRNVLKELNSHYKSALKLADKEVEEKGLSGCLFICAACLEPYLWKNEGGGECIFCGEQYDGETLARLYLWEQGICEYSVVKDGGEYPCYDCPECGSNSLVMSDEYDFARCFTCEVEYCASEFKFCSWCNGVFMEWNEDDNNMCSTCWENLLNKD